MKRLISNAPWALLAPSVALLALLSLYGCNDEVEQQFPCSGVVCGDNAFCVATTGECACNTGYELNGDVCELPRCGSDQDCDDGLTCNGEETCNLDSGQCQAGAPVVCGDNYLCDEASGDCLCPSTFVEINDACEPIACLDDSDCDDGLACNGDETCHVDSNVCTAGNPVRCDQNERCTESADGNICALHQPEGTSACMLIGTTDWASTGTLAVMDLSTGAISDNITTYAQDSSIRVVDQEVYVLERHMYDAVLKLDQRNNYQTLWNFSVSTNDYSVPNPHDMVRWGDYFFFALYNDGAILRANRNPNPLDPSSFLGQSPFSRRIDPPSWDGAFSELTALRVEGDILYGLTQGLADSWTCDTEENRSRIYAFNLPDLTDANIFEDGTNFLTLEHCNHGGWTPMPDGRLLAYALAGYRSIHGTGDDGGMQIFDVTQRKLGPVVATEVDANDKDIFSITRVGQRYFALLAGEDFGDVGVYETYPTADDSTWTFDAQPMYSGYAWSLFGFGETLYIAERSWGSEALYPYDLATKASSGPAIETVYAPESMRLFYREGGCW